MDPNRCVLCARCVRACAEIAASHTLGLRERGSHSMIMADVNLALGKSSCVGCGACLQVCPTGALIDSLSAYGGHEEDLTHTQTTCIQCSVGCTLDVVTRENRLLRVEGVWGAGPSGGLLCVDGRFRPLYDKRCRITKPQIRRNGKLVDADWDAALELVAKRLKNGSALGLAARATTNEAFEAFSGLLEQARRLEMAVPELGYGQPAKLRDIQEADFIVAAGADPLISQRVVGYFIKRAVDQGAQMALIDGSESELRDVATMTDTYDDANAIVERAAQATKVVVVYGAGLKPATITALKPLADKALFLALEPARNGKGAPAAKLVPLEMHAADTLFLLLGEQEENDSVIGQLNAAFTIVQASYYSPLAERADVVLPAPIWAERSGHVTNLEGEVLPLNAVVPMPPGVRDEAEVLRVLAEMM